MLTTIQLINEIFSRLKEKSDPAGVTELSHWSRASMLLKANLAQEELTLAIPGLFKTSDTSLTTTALGATYTVPSTVGRINKVSVDNVPLTATTKATLQVDPQWNSITGVASQWYEDLNGTKVGLYPVPVTAGGVITLEGEYLLTNMSDSASSYPMGNYALLQKAQSILIDMVAGPLAAEDGNFDYANWLLNQATKKTNDLIVYWEVLKKSDTKSTKDSHFEGIEG